MDCSGGFVSPGFFDCHVHVTLDAPSQMQIMETPFSLQFFMAAANLKKTLDTGITSVRDAGGADLGIKEAVSRGMIPGPRMQIAVIMLSQTGGHGDDWCIAGAEAPFMVPHPGRPDGRVDGPEEVRRRVREIIRAGADVIKVATTGGVLSPRDDPRHPHFRDDEIAEMTAEATAAGIHVMAHAQGAGGIKAALRNGVRSIEHGIFLDDEAIEMMLQRGAWLVPTLHAPRAVIARRGGRAADPEVLGGQGPRRRRGARRQRPPRPRGGGADRHGHRLRRRPARHQPRGARADDRRPGCHRWTPCTPPPARPPSCSTCTTTAARCGRASGPTWWSSTATPTTSPSSGSRVRSVHLDGVEVSRRDQQAG